MEDEKNYLYLELLKVIHVKKIKVLYWKTLRFRNMEKGQVLNMILDDLEKAGKYGYTVCYDVLNAYNFECLKIESNNSRIRKI